MACSCGEHLPKLVQTRSDSRLDGAERLLQPGSPLGMAHCGKERRFDRLSLIGAEEVQRAGELLTPLFELEDVVRVRSRLRDLRSIRLHAFLPLLEAQAIDGARSCLIQDP